MRTTSSSSRTEPGGDALVAAAEVMGGRGEDADCAISRIECQRVRIGWD
jgi:hypothetical protein